MDSWRGEVLGQGPSAGGADLQAHFPPFFFCFDLSQVECDDAVSQLWGGFFVCWGVVFLLVRLTLNCKEIHLGVPLKGPVLWCDK